MCATPSLEFTQSGRFWSAQVSLEDENFILLGNKLRSVDIHVYKVTKRNYEWYPVVTRLSERRLDIFIAVSTENMRAFKQNPSATFEIANDVECETQEGKFDKWIVNGPSWGRFVLFDADDPTDEIEVDGSGNGQQDLSGWIVPGHRA